MPAGLFLFLVGALRQVTVEVMYSDSCRQLVFCLFIDAITKTVMCLISFQAVEAEGKSAATIDKVAATILFYKMPAPGAKLSLHNDHFLAIRFILYSPFTVFLIIVFVV